MNRQKLFILIPLLFLIFAAMACTTVEDADGETQIVLNEEEKQLAVWVVIGLVVLWIGGGLIILPFDSEAAFYWWYFGLRAILILPSLFTGGGLGGGKSGGGGSNSKW